MHSTRNPPAIHASSYESTSYASNSYTKSRAINLRVHNICPSIHTVVGTTCHNEVNTGVCHVLVFKTWRHVLIARPNKISPGHMHAVQAAADKWPAQLYQPFDG